MARPDSPPAPQLSEGAIDAILGTGGISDNSADIHVHEDASHICVTLVGAPPVEGLQGFVMFCDMHM